MTFEILTMTSCRWSIRNIAVLIEKRVDYRLVDVSENGRKATWYTALTPFGKTPALRHAGHILVESLMINEYLEAVAPGRKLLPPQPLECAWGRIWNAYCDAEVMPLLGAVLSNDFGQRERALSDLGTCFGTLEANLFRYAQRGTFWGGEAPSLTDICYWSLFDVLNRVDLLQPARQLLEAHPRLRQWGVDLLGYPVFIDSVASLESLKAN